MHKNVSIFIKKCQDRQACLIPLIKRLYFWREREREEMEAWRWRVGGGGKKGKEKVKRKGDRAGKSLARKAYRHQLNSTSLTLKLQTPLLWG